MASDPLVFFIPGLPVPWARAGKRGKVHYTRPVQKAYMQDIALRAAAAMSTQELKPFVGAVCLDIRFTIPIPSRFGKAAREAAMDGGEPACTGADYDNLSKIITDALNGLAYEDDRQIAHAVISKYYGPNPHTRVVVSEWGRGQDLT